MLVEIGINIAEIGHSERRQYYNETDYTVNNKVQPNIDGLFIGRAAWNIESFRKICKQIHYDK